MWKSLADTLAGMPEGTLSTKAESVITPEMTTSEAVQALQAEHLPMDAVDLMSRGMPAEDGVLWSTKSTEAVSDQLSPEGLKALDAAREWGKEPTEANRQKALAAAGDSEPSSPATWSAFAAGWSGSGGSDALEGANAPDSDMTPKAVSGSVKLSALTAPAAPAEGERESAATPPEFEVPDIKIPDVPEAPTVEVPELPEVPAAPELHPPPEPFDPEALSPEQQEALDKAYEPFLEMGQKIGDGKVTWE